MLGRNAASSVKAEVDESNAALIPWCGVGGGCIVSFDPFLAHRLRTDVPAPLPHGGGLLVSASTKDDQKLFLLSATNDRLFLCFVIG